MKNAKSTNRRNFLLAAGIGGAAAAAIVGQRVKPAGKTVAAGEGAKPSGYRESEHVRKYYKTTAV
jgi:hypothetical protein